MCSCHCSTDYTTLLHHKMSMSLSIIQFRFDHHSHKADVWFLRSHHWQNVDCFHFTFMFFFFFLSYIAITQQLFLLELHSGKIQIMTMTVIDKILFYSYSCRKSVNITQRLNFIWGSPCIDCPNEPLYLYRKPRYVHATLHVHSFGVFMLWCTLLYCTGVHSLCTLGWCLSVAITFGLRGTAISALFWVGSVPLQWFPSALIKIATFVWAVVGVQWDLELLRGQDPAWDERSKTQLNACHTI